MTQLTLTFKQCYMNIELLLSVGYLRPRAMNCMHLCLWKILSQDCPHGKIKHFLCCSDCPKFHFHFINSFIQSFLVKSLITSLLFSSQYCTLWKKECLFTKHLNPLLPYRIWIHCRCMVIQTTKAVTLMTVCAWLFFAIHTVPGILMMKRFNH